LRHPAIDSRKSAHNVPPRLQVNPRSFLFEMQNVNRPAHPIER
jgi:hypothetical protein